MPELDRPLSGLARVRIEGLSVWMVVTEDDVLHRARRYVESWWDHVGLRESSLGVDGTSVERHVGAASEGEPQGRHRIQ
jgi:hypothetical protein